MKFIICGLALVVGGCASLKDHSVYQGQDGLFRVQINGERDATLSAPENALRDEQGHVLTDPEVANQRLRSISGPIHLMDSFRSPDCSSTKIYQAKVHQFRAQENLKAKQFREALIELGEAEKTCSGIDRISAQDYFRAVALSAMGEPTLAKESAQRFLQNSSAYDPAAYQQGESANAREDMALFEREALAFAKFRESARRFVNEGGSLLLPISTDDVAKFDHNAFFRPGGNRREGIFLLPIITYDSLLGMNAGLAGYYSWGKYGLGLSYSGGSLGSFYGLKVRDSIYESLKRDWNVDFFAAGYTHKRLSYKDNGYFYSDVTVIQSAFEPGIGFGLTKRWTPQFGFAGELAAFENRLDRRTDVIGSLYTFYDFWRESGPSLGYIQNRPMIAWSIAFLQLGYNFRAHSVDAVIQGFTF